MAFVKSYITREKSTILLVSKIEYYETEFNGFQCELLPQRASSWMLQVPRIHLCLH